MRYLPSFLSFLGHKLITQPLFCFSLQISSASLRPAPEGAVLAAAPASEVANSVTESVTAEATSIEGGTAAEVSHSSATVGAVQPSAKKKSGGAGKKAKSSAAGTGAPKKPAAKKPGAHKPAAKGKSHKSASAPKKVTGAAKKYEKED